MERAIRSGEVLERVMGFEPTISCLGSKRSTTELHPRERRYYTRLYAFEKRARGADYLKFKVFLGRFCGFNRVKISLVGCVRI